MAIHEAVAGLGLRVELAELGVPASATLDAELGVGFATEQQLELAAALGFSARLQAQAGGTPSGGEALIARPMTGGEYALADERSIDRQPYLVTGLSHATLEARRFEAANAPGIPLEGAAHPVIPDIQVTAKNVRFQLEGEQFDQTRAIVDVTWSVPTADDLFKSGGKSGGGFLTLALSSFSESIWRDRDGAIMKVFYKATVGTFSRTVEAQVQRNTWTATLTKEFDAPQYADMLRAGVVNSANFGPFTKNQLLFLGPTVNETDEGKFSHGYQMMFNPDGWKLRASIWVSGFVPDNATTVFAPPAQPGGLGEFDINEEIDFATFPVFFP